MYQVTLFVLTYIRKLKLMEFQVVNIKNMDINLTDGIFETGAYAVPSKSQNSTVLGQGGSSSTQCSNSSLA